MTETLPSVNFELWDVRGLRLQEVPAPQLTTEHEAARDLLWDKAVLANPHLFDGPVVACAGIEWEGPADLLVSWARVTYRHYVLRRVPGCTSWLPSMFVNIVQPTVDGRVLVARMSSATAAPGRWQLPGGSLEPPGPGQGLDEAEVRSHAARELLEETGLDRESGELVLWAVTRCQHRSISMVYLAPPSPEALLRDRSCATFYRPEPRSSR
ncbi:NUDIX domain-containing protein [Streptomyces sp. RFCAC02]|uniref:NUDIX hydrolase n=1 Tax=Streptomyces sp. RFCAC02 TaxID=2499143 RepID=UPI00101FE420|nr:NUDIX domain-containing protein [Streptomyces sp. RFCAC02]